MIIHSKECVSISERIEISNLLIGDGIGWIFGPPTDMVHGSFSENHTDENTMDYIRLRHEFYIDGKSVSNSSSLADRLIEIFKSKNSIDLGKIGYVRAELFPRATNFRHHWYNTPHVISDKTKFALLYNVDDCDTDTYIFDRKYGEPNTGYKILEKFPTKSGDFILIPGDVYYTQVHPIMFEKRITVVFEFV